MKPGTKSKKLTVLQDTLAQLFEEHLIPFEVTAQKVEEQSLGVYEVHCADSRLPSLKFSWKDGESFKQVLRSAVLIRIKATSGDPVDDWIM